MKKTVATGNGCPIGYSWTYGYVMLIINERAFIRHGTSISYYNGPTSGANTLRTTDWVHIALVRDTTTSFILYINGTNVYNNSITASQGSVSTQIDRLGRESDNGNPLGGNIDEVAAWNVPLSPSDITSIYNDGTPNDISGISGLIAWYRMGENSTFSSQILMPENTNKDKFSNYSMQFDGINDSITTTSSISGDITLSAWINCNGTYTAWQPRYPLSITPSHSGLPNATIGRLYKQGASLWVGLQMYDQNGANVSTYTAQGVSLEGAGWKNLVWTFDNTTKQIYLYINGVAQTWTHYGGVITTPYLTCPGYLYNSNLKMGTRVGYYFFDGLVDEVATFDSIKAIGDIWDGSGKPTDLTGQSGLVGYWKMGEEATYDAVASEWTVPDQIGSNDGTSANMDINDRTGNAPDSSNNALSYNMDAADIVEDVPPNP
jgi:hypothetical protein